LISTYDSTYSEFGLAQSKLWPVGTGCITIAANIAASGILTFPACFPDSVVGLVPAPGVSGDYVEYFIRTARENLDRYAPATAQKNINLDILERVLVPMPAPDEQSAICSRVREVMSSLDVLERTLDAGRSQAVALRQAILQAAFSGQFVPQDPSDEPAAALLARIASQSAQATDAPAVARRRGRPMGRRPSQANPAIAG
jgi:type I restriction enzyme S subunit